MTDFVCEDGVVFTEEGIDVDRSDAASLKARAVFKSYDNMKWVGAPHPEPPSTPAKPCRYCKVPGSYPGERGRALYVGTVVTCTNCNAYWKLVKVGPYSDSMTGKEDDRWHMVALEVGDEGEPVWVTILHEGRNWRGQKVQKPYKLTSG